MPHLRTAAIVLFAAALSAGCGRSFVSEGCDDDDECPIAQACVQGDCRPAPCFDDGDCPATSTCVRGYCSALSGSSEPDAGLGGDIDEATTTRRTSGGIR